MKKIGLILCSCLTFALSNVMPEYYEKNLEILRDLDIEASFIKDVNFMEDKEDLSKMHAGVLLRASKEFYEFIPMIRQIIKDENLPKEFLYLAMVESGLKSHSVSNAKAVGMWQFMEGTAKELGLRIDAYVDERRDPFKSTLAASAYLKQLKGEFGKWYLAILAYNCGNGKLNKAIKEAGSDELHILLDEEAKYIPQETRLFVKKILTLAFLANNKDFILEQDQAFVNYALTKDFVKVKTPQSVSLKDLAKVAGISYADLKRFNPQFRYDFTPPDAGYYMYVPLSKSSNYEEQIQYAKLAKVDTRIPQTKIYKVKAGDSLYSIAKKHQISIASIKALNKIKKTHLSINQKLILPIKNKETKYAKQSPKRTQVVSR